MLKEGQCKVILRENGERRLILEKAAIENAKILKIPHDHHVGNDSVAM